MATREGSDEAYIVGLCDRILGESALPQHRFDWLRGDPGVGGRRVKLPVDAYWPGHQLVVEYRELQHDQPMPHFDKPDRDGIIKVKPARVTGWRKLYKLAEDDLLDPRALALPGWETLIALAGALVAASHDQHLRRHDLRHTALTWFADAGVPVHVRRRIAGHGSLTTTQRYLHPDVHRITTAGEPLSAHFNVLRAPRSLPSPLVMTR
ncbi:site-specific integrase [Streptomyces sp. NBC_00441]|uniref:tyrosine-type recombinase/integrase n=1 Tax=Streptomyces sp. NBC_00441 TaxID=2975742 RepID=UPI002E2E3DCD|nr:tyrosine-type recombinase/integrase [Streptomyces sp. NBC_00441]